MQKQTSIYIPTPCREDWGKMSPAQHGKFCAACNKQVIDFSLMSDNQILHFLSTQSGKLCGRFDADQLQRPLIETKIKKKRTWWMAIAMPLLFLFEKSGAQENKMEHNMATFSSNEKTKCTNAEQDSAKILIGKIAPNEVSDGYIIRGKVVDQDGAPLCYVTIMEKGSKSGTVTDSAGFFSIKISGKNDSITLVASHVGYQTQERIIAAKEENINITMQLSPVLMGDVVVTASVASSQQIIAGGIAICQKVTRTEKIDAAIRKSLKIASFKIYPNPATRNSAIHIQIKQPGEYQLQLLDNQSTLIKADNINIAAGASAADFTVPPNMAAGIYYLRLINRQTAKSFTEKLIIQ